ncbi:hypothetical protein HY045_02555 [Candidatus Woesebacteria bacterium]|nr:hypothetical protein [Candidatus Woesebacteria bacterium]
MKKAFLILTGLTLLLLVGLLAVELNRQNKEKSLQVVDSGLSYEPKSMQMGEVEVKVTPTYVKSRREIIFTLDLNTHTVDLTYDYKKIASLREDAGNVYAPISWTGETGGHHLSGKLAFGKLSAGVKKIMLKLSGIDNKEANFEWDI